MRLKKNFFWLFFWLCIAGLVGLQAISLSAACFGSPIESAKNESLPCIAVYEFTLPSCAACEKMKPVVEALKKEGVKITVLDILTNPDVAKDMHVTGAPTFVAMQNGKVLKRIVGVCSKEDILPVQARTSNISDCMDATCRISVADGVGTGCVFEISNGYVFILTAYHVLEGCERQDIKCEFWSSGHQSRGVSGKAIQFSKRTDLAIIAIPTTSFRGRLPKVVPVAPRGYRALKGAQLLSVGCANGAWETAWKGHVLNYETNGDLRFTPPPVSGRSGSAIFDGEGKMIVGIIQARTKQAGAEEGIAISIDRAYEEFSDRITSNESAITPLDEMVAVTTPVQCPGGVCPIRPNPSPRSSTPRIDESGPLYPSMPVEETAQGNGSPSSQAIIFPNGPRAIRAEAEETNRQLNQIADLLQNRMNQPTTPASPVYDPSGQQALAEINKLRNEIPGIVASTTKPLAEAVQKQTELLGPLYRIKEKLDADIEAGGIKGRIAEKIQDRWEDGSPLMQLAGDGHWKPILIIGAVIVSILIYLNIRKHRLNNEPLTIQAMQDKITTRLQGAALANPALAPLAAAATVIDKGVDFAASKAVDVNAIVDSKLQQLRDQVHGLAVNASPPNATLVAVQAATPVSKAPTPPVV